MGQNCGWLFGVIVVRSLYITLSLYEAMLIKTICFILVAALGDRSLQFGVMERVNQNIFLPFLDHGL